MCVQSHGGTILSQADLNARISTTEGYCQMAITGECHILRSCPQAYTFRSAALVYDYAVTFPNEVQLFWRRKATGASLLFFVNRYLALFRCICVIATSGPMSDSVSSRPASLKVCISDSGHPKDVCIHSLDPRNPSRFPVLTAAASWPNSASRSSSCSIFLGRVSYSFIEHERPMHF